MSSSTRLLVLGVVKLFQPVHGYIVRRELLSWRAQEWASIQPGSIYNALKTLTRDGLIEVASTDQVGGRPERTTYRLTSAGTEEFHTLLREQWWTVHAPVDPLMAAVSFLGEISRAEAISALEHRAAQVHAMVRAVEFAIENHDDRESPDHVREMMRLMNARVSSELAWSRDLVERLRRGEYATGDEPPWRAPSTPPPRRGARSRSPDPRSRRDSPPRPADRSAPRPAVRTPPADRTNPLARRAPRSDERRRRSPTDRTTSDSAARPPDALARSPDAPSRRRDATVPTPPRPDRTTYEASPRATGRASPRSAARDPRRDRRFRSRGPRR